MQYGGTAAYSHSLDDDWAEAVAVLHRLSQNLYGLEYLDLTGCGPWLPALVRRVGHDEVDWVRDFGKVETLVLYGCSGVETSGAVEQVSPSTV